MSTSEIQKVLDLAGVEALVVRAIQESDNKTIYVLNIARTDASNVADKFIAKAAKTGYCPVFPSDADIEDLIGTPGTASKILTTGKKYDIEAWLGGAKDDRISLGDFSKRKVTLAKVPMGGTLYLVPTKLSWQIPAYLPFSGYGWNACPSTSVHIALLKRWYEKYGANLLTVGKDSLFLQVKQPVTNKDDALVLAYEHARYCPDNVLQGHGDGTISGLAMDLIDARVWQFWWD